MDVVGGCRPADLPPYFGDPRLGSAVFIMGGLRAPDPPERRIRRTLMKFAHATGRHRLSPGPRTVETAPGFELAEIDNQGATPCDNDTLYVCFGLSAEGPPPLYVRPVFICVLATLPRGGVLGEGPDGHFPPTVCGFRPVLAQIQMGSTCLISRPPSSAALRPLGRHSPKR